MFFIISYIGKDIIGFITNPIKVLTLALITFIAWKIGNKLNKDLEDYEHKGDLLKVKTFHEITRLEKNGLFLYESVPGTAVNHFLETEDGVVFTVEGPEDAQITLGLAEDTEYDVIVGNADAGKMKTNLGGKLSLSVELAGFDQVKVEIKK